MKKVFSFLTVAFLSIAAVSVISCKKDNGPKHHEDDEDDDPEFVNLIKVDGDFADWNGIDCTTVTNANQPGQGGQADGQRVGDIKTLKIAADGLYLYLYLEVDRNHDDGGGASWDGTPLNPLYAGPLDVYINADNDTATGGIYWLWDPIGWEYLFESATAFGETPGDLSDGSLFAFTGEDGTDIWAVDPPAREDVSINGMVSGKGVNNGGVIKYEMSLLRSAMPKITGDKIKIGVLLQSENWKLIGALPCEAQAADATNLVASTLVEFTLPAAE